MNNLRVSLIVNGGFKKCLIPENLLIDLIDILQTNSKYTVHFVEESVEAEGVIIMGKGSKTGLMALPNTVE